MKTKILIGILLVLWLQIAFGAESNDKNIRTYGSWVTMTTKLTSPKFGTADAYYASTMAPSKRRITMNCLVHPRLKLSRQGFLLQLLDPINKTGEIVQIDFAIRGKKFKLPGVINDDRSTVTVPLPSVQNELIDLMMAGQWLQITAPVASGIYPVHQSFSLNGFEQASEVLRKACRGID